MNEIFTLIVMILCTMLSTLSLIANGWITYMLIKEWRTLRKERKNGNAI